MRWLPLVALLAVGCGDDPLQPSPPVNQPPPPTIALCEVPVIPSANNGQLLCIAGEGCIPVSQAASVMLVPCE